MGVSPAIAAALVDAVRVGRRYAQTSIWRELALASLGIIAERDRTIKRQARYIRALRNEVRILRGENPNYDRVYREAA